MPSQLPDYELISLLKHCLSTPRCQTLRGLIRPRPRKSSSSLRASQYSPPTNTSQQQREYWTLRSDYHGDIAAQSIELSCHSKENTLDFKSHLSPLQGHNAASQHKQRKPDRIAVLGGGITGLSTAYYLARELPNSKITVYEGSNRLGGWLQTKRVDVGVGSILFESGPRTLRPNTPAAMATLEMISDLGLKDQLIITSKDSIAARNRFVYYPDHLVRMPGPGQDLYTMAWSFLTEPIFKGLLAGALFEYTRPSRPTNLEDESVGSFLERRLGSSHPANNVVSAVLHGIYAGDIYQLSARSLMPKFWYYEGLRGSVTNSMFSALREGSVWIPLRDATLQNELVNKVDKDILNSMSAASVYTFKSGISALSKAVEQALRDNPNVQFKMNTSIGKIEYDDEEDVVKIAGSSGQASTTYERAISTISARNLSKLATNRLRSLEPMHAVTVMVVNLYFSDPNILPEHGFGYLIPRSISFDQNPEFALGVVFDSDTGVSQDSISGTKVTVMLGGHWWDGFASYPDEQEAVQMAKAVLRRHLRVEDEPAAVNVALQRECIPQYIVGHDAGMKAAHNELFSEFRGRLAVAGNSYTGVGLNDCVRAARDVVMDLKDGSRKTGLEQFARQVEWAQTRLPSRAEAEREMQRRGLGEKPPGN